MMELEAHRRWLFGVCYRMTGVAADAEDLVQQTFARALEANPDRTRALEPWLTTVAMNLARDHLRARKARGYVGPFLPSPIPADEEEVIAHEPHDDGKPRYELLESVSMAFLVALEVLSPTQRAVLLLRDVFDYSVRETAEALELTEANVKVVHHRARAAMAKYDEDEPWATRERAREALALFLAALGSGDVHAVERLLARDARAVNDGGGEFFAARLPVVGREKVALFYSKLAANVGELEVATVLDRNGWPMFVSRRAVTPPGEAPLSVTWVQVGADGLITEIGNVLATRKLTHLAL